MSVLAVDVGGNYGDTLLNPFGRHQIVHGQKVYWGLSNELRP